MARRQRDTAGDGDAAASERVTSGAPVITADEFLLGRSRAERGAIRRALRRDTNAPTARTRAEWTDLLETERKRPVAQE